MQISIEIEEEKNNSSFYSLIGRFTPFQRNYFISLVNLNSSTHTFASRISLPTSESGHSLFRSLFIINIRFVFLSSNLSA